MKFVIGHKNPDTDTVVSAMTMAAFLSLRDGQEYVPAIAGAPNSETAYIFKRFNAKLPGMEQGGKVFLVDHNEASQIPEGINTEDIIGIVDHHKINFQNAVPIEIHTMPWGSTNTIIHDLFEKEGIALPDKYKPLMLAAILSDTVILQSPTTTKKDIETAQSLASQLGIDIDELGMEMFKAKSMVADKSAEEIVYNDFKEFDFSGKKVGVGQVEVPDLAMIKPRYNEIITFMKSLQYHTLILMATDIIKKGSELIIVTEDEKRLQQLFGKMEGNVTGFLEGVMSRKKQIVPKLEENL